MLCPQKHCRPRGGTCLLEASRQAGTRHLRWVTHTYACSGLGPATAAGAEHESVPGLFSLFPSPKRCLTTERRKRRPLPSFLCAEGAGSSPNTNTAPLSPPVAHFLPPGSSQGYPAPIRLRCAFTEGWCLHGFVLGPRLFPLWSDPGPCSKASSIQTRTRV